jgi:CDP-glycerol glycerophosphotransferase
VRAVWFSFRGLYADNPRALYEALTARAGDSIDSTWICTPATQGNFPPGVRTVLFGTAECVAALESADLVVGNDCISLDWTKKPGATYLQTWHGTPLKHIHHDVRPVRPGWLDKADRDVARWDLLLSPNAVSAPRLAGAFGFRGPVHTTGYPRNDVLSSPRREEVRAATRTRLGIPDGRTAVLYTPTWRDDLVFDDDAPDFELPIDLDDFTERLGDDHVLLLRLHSMVKDRFRPRPGQAVVDVSTVADSAELYLAADVMVTDYSSSMFDFAVTGKPMIFFVYDLEHYRDELRGFYDDLTEIAPGPLVRSSPELVDAIADADRAAGEYAAAYNRFQQTFCGLEDGHATERVLDLLFPSGGIAGRTTQERG